ncbi:MAG: GNAT family protein [Candidatus Eremiobacterota bacterium]
MIKGKEIDLWALERYDLLEYLKWSNDRELIHLTGMPVLPKSMNELENWYQQAIKNPGNKFFAIRTKEGEYIGNIELNFIDWINRNLEIGILIGKKDFRGRGLGLDATLTVLHFIFEHLDFHRAYLSVISYNKHAINLYEKCGFKKEGIKREAFLYMGQYVDIVEMALLKYEFEEIKNNKFKDFFEEILNSE